MKNYFFSIVLISLIHSGYSQPCSTPALNLQKYWEYRERLKDFVVIGADSGCSLISNNRGGDSYGIGTFNYNDEPTPLGYYIGVLASEYYLLDKQASDSASIYEKYRTLGELYYALAAVNRLDQNAEAYWRYYYSGGSYITYNTDLNGFLIRDDISSGFLNDVENGDYVENDLNKGLAPPPDGIYYKAGSVTTSFMSGINSVSQSFYIPCGSESGRRGGPQPMSKDELTQLYVGLAIVTKLLPLTSNQYYRSVDLTTMALNIAENIDYWMNANAGYIINPVTGSCETGMVWGSYAPISNFDPCKCIAAGANPGTAIGGYFMYGFNSAVYAMANGFSSYSICYNPLWLWYKNFYVGNTEFMPLTLGTIGKSWGSVTGGVINSKALKAVSTSNYDLDGLPLLYTVLWGENTADYGATYYSTLLDDAPCHGTFGNNGNYEWSQGDRWEVGPNKPHNNFGAMFYGVDYMLFFNLFNIAYPTLIGSPGNYVNYHYIPANYLRYDSLVKTNFTENSEKNFLATDSIEAGNIGNTGNYIIQTYNDPLRPMLPLKKAEVHFKAGQLIDLLPGFVADSGILLFDASIDTSIHTMICSNCDPSYNVEANLLPYVPPSPGDEVNFFGTDSIRSCVLTGTPSMCDTLNLFGINGDTLGISTWHWDFGNGKTSTSSHPSVIYCNYSYTQDTTYQLTLIVTDSATSVQDTLMAWIVLYCPGAGHHAVLHQFNNLSDSATPEGKYPSGAVESFNLVPSATSANTTMEYTLPKQTAVTITIANTLGIKIGTIVNTIQSAGAYNIIYSTSSLPPGIYYVSMATDDFFETKKLVVIK